MSARPQEAPQQPIGELYNVFNDAWLDALAWIERGEGMKFSLVNSRFDRVVDNHFNLRKWSLGKLSIRRATRRNGAEISSMKGTVRTKALPMPITPPPAGIIGFKSLFIRYLDTEVINFLHSIGRLFKSDITLDFSIGRMERRAWALMAQEIWPLIRTSITTLTNMKRINFVLLRKHISPTVLVDCVNLRKIFTYVFPRRPPLTAADAAARGRSSAAEEDLFTWLHTPRNTDELPKILRILKWTKPRWDRLIYLRWRQYHWQRVTDDLQQHFGVSSTVVNYMVSTLMNHPPETFDRQNDQTGENLSLLSYHRRSICSLVPEVAVMRYPIAYDRNRMKLKWLKQTTEFPKKMVKIRIRDEDIGPLSLAKADPSSNNMRT